ncbi:hypothetical protein ABRZ24_13900 [Brenneria populi]|uniref:Uncharacterized protein n=1 Tax=Brenneria populi TaxID=1505588 RepID=A0ABU6JSE3_9GAMM|nr:hypothetical protein [Brenneria populi Li et al. 2015]
MKHPRKGTTSATTYRTAEVFARMGVAMEELMTAAPKILGQKSIDGTQECHGPKKENKKAAA